jgi:protein SCO1/2
VKTFVVLMLVFFAYPLYAGDAIMSKGEVQGWVRNSGLPKALKAVGYDQHLDQQLSLDAPVVDENGNHTTLGSFFGKKPVVFVMAYYECPMLCTQVMNGVFGSLKAVPFKAGQDYDVISLSINPNEGPELALKKKNAYVNGYHQQEFASGYHFLTAPQSTIDLIAKQTGFRYSYDSVAKQFAHAAGMIVMTPQGKISRYFYGIEFAPRDVKFGLMEASQEHIGTVVDQVLLYCYHYDPATGKYGAAITNLLRIGGGLTILFIGGLFYNLRRRTKAQASLKLGNLA